MYTLLIIIGVIILDQISKFIVVQNMVLNQSIPIINNFFHITYVLNPGAAFGILAYQTPFFLIVTTLVVGVLGYYVYKLKKEQWLLKIAFSLQIGGAIGNFIDRYRGGYVIDFLDFKIWSPVFNIADMAIVVGVGLFALEVLLEFMEERKTKARD